MNKSEPKMRTYVFKVVVEPVEMIIEELIEDGEPIPEAPEEEVQVFAEPRALVTVYADCL